MPRKTKIQLLTKTSDSTTALSSVDLDLGEPLVDNTAAGRKVIIGGVAHTDESNTNKADNTTNIILGASYNTIEENILDNGDRDGVVLKHDDNTVRSTHIITGDSKNISVSLSSPNTTGSEGTINVNITSTPGFTAVGVGADSGAADKCPVALKYDSVLSALVFDFK